MSLRRLILLLLVLLPCMTRGQGECTPEPLPYFEDFSTGFEWDNGWYIPWLDTTYQEDDHCWTLCWLHASEWNTLVHTGALSRRPIELRIRINKINDIYNLIDEYKFAVSPHMAAAPWRLQFEAGYYNAYPDINYDIQQADLQLTDGARLAIGYVTDDNDCINSYVPFDTLKVSGHWVYPEEILQPFDIDLGRYFDTFPEPWRIAFRPEKTDEYQDVLLLVDNIRISDELSEYHCTADYVDTICQGTGYYHHGFHILPQRTNDLGTRHYSYVDTTGCLVSLDLTVTGTHTTILVDTVPCGQPSPYAPDTVLGEGSHYFHLSDRYGCDSLVTITIHQAWVTHLYDSIQEGDTLLFEGQTLTSGGIYTHDTVASDGCDSLVVLHLRCLPLPAVNTDTLTFWFPNVFTPGRDDNNRFGCITATEMLEFEMFIFNRWGLMVFHTEDINDWWDGGGLPQGAYVYTYRLRTPDGRVYTGKGTVTLLR